MYRQRASSQDYIKWLRKKGISIGDGTRFFDPLGTEIDVTQPHLVTIGSDVMITQGVIILTHGFDWFVLNGVYGDILGSAGRVKIGNNVFIGSKSIILKNVCIGDNVIIGAGSVVTKDIPNNVVAAGNPARVISTLEAYYEKRKTAQLSEAMKMYKEYKLRRGGYLIKEFFMSFSGFLKTVQPANLIYPNIM